MLHLSTSTCLRKPAEGTRAFDLALLGDRIANHDDELRILVLTAATARRIGAGIERFLVKINAKSGAGWQFQSAIHKARRAR